MHSERPFIPEAPAGLGGNATNLDRHPDLISIGAKFMV